MSCLPLLHRQRLVSHPTTPQWILQKLGACFMRLPIPPRDCGSAAAAAPELRTEWPNLTLTARRSGRSKAHTQGQRGRRLDKARALVRTLCCCSHSGERRAAQIALRKDPSLSGGLGPGSPSNPNRRPRAPPPQTTILGKRGPNAGMGGGWKHSVHKGSTLNAHLLLFLMSINAEH